MSYVPHGSYYGGYDDFEDDGGFDFGDSYDSQTCREKFEPTLSAVINPSRSSEQTGNVQSREEDDGEEHANSRNFDNSGTDIAKVQGVKVEVQPEDGVPAPGSEAFFVGSDSPESSPRHTTGVLKSGTAAQGSPGSHKKSRFSPNLSPSYSKSKTSRQSRQRYLVADCQGELRSKYKKGSGSTDESSHDPHEQSRMLEKGEELKVAISRGNVERVMEILDGGFDPNMKLSTSWTPLMHACDRGQDEIVKVLLERGANPNAQKDQFTALMAVCANKTSKRDKLVNCARLVIDKGARVNSHDRHHMSPLLYASQNGHTQLAELLISANADVYKQDSRNWTALSYAANKGHLQLVQLLVNHNANPEAATFSGDTPSSLALDGGHTAVADWLDSVTSSREDGLSITSLPTHPLLDGAKGINNSLLSQSKDQTTASLTGESDSTKPSTSTFGVAGSLSQSGCVQYGELELFLLGQQLGDLLPLFRKHRVQFSDLLSMTEKDLETMGVAQVGLRKKLLTGIVDMHQRQWDMPKTSVLPYGRAISSSEATVILSHLTRHTNYIKGTTRYLLNHVTSNPEMIDTHMERSEVEKLANELAGTVEAITSFQQEVGTLESEIRSLLPDEQSPAVKDSNRKRRLLNVVKVASVVTIVSVTSYLVGRYLVQYRLK